MIKNRKKKEYSDGLTLIRCKIIGTQPLCYCKNLKLVDCEMVDTDLAFEKSEVDAVITTKVDSIKNPLSGRICVPEVGEVIMDDQLAKGEVMIGGLKEVETTYTIPSEKPPDASFGLLNGGMIHGRDAATRESYGNGENIRFSAENRITADDFPADQFSL